jgi:DNA-binding helix-hairpin-helix protein with protein kinase domain
MQKIELSRIIGVGGEANIWELKDYPQFIAKVYTKSNVNKNEIKKLQKTVTVVSRDSFQIRAANLHAKLRFMIKNPPEFTRSDNRQILAWPNALIYDSEENIIGYLMKKIEKSIPLDELLDIEERHEKYSYITWLDLHQIAYSISYLVFNIHKYNHIIVDLSPRNILINPITMDVSIIDTDSFQVFDKHNETYYFSNVQGTPGFIAPEELIQPSQAKSMEGDYYSLGAILYRLLFTGFPHEHGSYEKDRTINVNQYAQKGLWINSRYSNRELETNAATPSMTVLHSKIQELFYRCFDDGFDNKNSRPTPIEWMEAIEHSHRFISKESCDNGHHYYDSKPCYWCEHQKNVGIDLFPLSDLFPPGCPPVMNETDFSVMFQSQTLIPEIHVEDNFLMVLKILKNPLTDNKNPDESTIRVTGSTSLPINRNIISKLTPYFHTLIVPAAISLGIIGSIWFYSEHKCMIENTNLCPDKSLMSQ